MAHNTGGGRMTSSMQEGEIRTILAEWVQQALSGGNGDFSVADAERELRAMPGAAAWAISGDAATLWVLGADEALRVVRRTDRGEIESTLVLPLRGEAIRIVRADRQSAPYRDSEAATETAWSFAYMNGDEFLTLVGTTWIDRLSGHQRGDRAALLAEALVALAERNAAR